MESPAAQPKPAMTAPRTTDADGGFSSSHGIVVTLATGAVAVVSATTVAWAAVTTVHASVPVQSVQQNTRRASDAAAVQELLRTRALLEGIRRDVASIDSDADELPRPPANVPVGVGAPTSSYSTTYVSPPSGATYVPPPTVIVQPAAAAPAPPPTQATTGATGVVVH